MTEVQRRRRLEELKIERRKAATALLEAWGEAEASGLLPRTPLCELFLAEGAKDVNRS